MAMYILLTIEDIRDKSGLEAAQAKYHYFFFEKKSFAKYKQSVDVMLKMDGYEDCIVEG